MHIGYNEAEPNPLAVVKAEHGVLTILIAFVWIHIVALAQLPLTELMWHLPFALIGSGTVLCCYFLGSMLQSRRAGLLAALLVAVLPLHTAFSRTSGESHFVLSAFLQPLTLLLWWRYLISRQARLAWFAGAALGADILTDFAFPGLLLTLIWAAWFYYRRQGAPDARALAARALLQWRMIVPTLPALALHAFGAVETLFLHHPVGIFGRILTESGASHTGVGGLFVRPTIENTVYATNGVFLGVVLLYLALFAIRPPLRTAGAQLALLWFGIYTLPFLLLFNRARLIGHFIPISVGMCLFVACMSDTLCARRQLRLVVSSAQILLALALLLSTLSMIYRWTPIAALYHPVDTGSVGVERGTKAAAYWIRQNTPPTASIYGDPYAQQTKRVSMYYYHRPTVSFDINTETSVEQAMQLAATSQSSLDALVVGVEHLPLLPPTVTAAFRPSAIITVGGAPSLYILVRASALKPGAEPTVLDAAVGNSEYDARYAAFSDVITMSQYSR